MSITARHKTSIGRTLFRCVGLALLVVFILGPLVQTIMVSFVSTLPHDDLARGQLTLVNYRNIFADPDLVASLGNSLIYVSLNVVLTLSVALPAAYALSRHSFVGDRHLMLLLLTFRITPPVVLSLLVFLLFARLNLLNSPVGIALIHCLFNVPIAIWILTSFISAIPREFDESAFLDGHSRAGFFVRFLMPAIAPGIGVACFFCFVFSWVEVVFARILTSTGGKPITMAIQALFGFTTDIGLVMAMTVISLVPGVALIFFVRKHISKGFQVRA
ncbi:carbohydrate ABC transporter membrane protein 2 (CUT1 family) [Litoreibacter meonggei]|uniref:Carbohydrate ABC transporter membrane protein 2 (CUT1 family) n=1 Tax=Litoreibacter meonggei TaxID=1049199 RepID=A0A497X4S6_9RHOB|nr:carbohydrate ABC transporter permease [Litoreibacter meonggei]RLJ60121.1 carbohydrate ABC transporter membrane protein 2 (CUT1 family) [Litoreibacter meonggei]